MFSFINRILVHICGVFLVVLLLLLCVNVGMRYALNNPIPWAEQVTNYFLILITFLAAPAVLAEQGHVSIEMVRERFKGKAGLRFDRITHLLGLIYCAWFTYWGVVEVLKLYERNSYFFEAINVPQWIIVSIIPVGGLLMTIEFINKLIIPASSMKQQ